MYFVLVLCFSFSWEELTVHPGSISVLRLLAVGSQCELKLFEVEVGRSGSTTLVCLCQCPAGSLVQMLNDKDLSKCCYHLTELAVCVIIITTIIYLKPLKMH